jgi:hypothetical protein
MGSDPAGPNPSKRFRGLGSEVYVDTESVKNANEALN